MTQTPSHPLSFVKTIDQALLDLDQKPQFAAIDPFPWKELTTKLQEIFGGSSFSFSHKIRGWQNQETLLNECREEDKPLEIFFSPLTPPLYWIVSESDQKKLLMTLLDGEEEATYFLEPSYVEGFHSFFVASCLDAIESIGYAKGLSPKMGTPTSNFHETVKETSGFFVIDMTLQSDCLSFFGKLLISPDFRRGWNQHFLSSMDVLPPYLKQELSEKIALEVAFEVGKACLTLDQWKSVECGDWILLDDCFYDPEEKSGRLIMTLKGTPLFRGKIKEEGIKLFEYPTYEEVKHPMDEKDFEEEEEDDLYGDLDEDFEDDFEEEGEDLEDEEEFDIEEDDDEEEEEEDEEEEEEVSEKKQPAPEKMPKKTLESAKPSISPEEIPVELTIEVGRLRMSAKELMQLTPGNLLELNLAPERGVDLMVGGKKIGRGELIKLGELLGVRILEF